MLDIMKIDHIGIRVRDKDRSINFYESLGFKFITDVGFENGHPVMMESPNGIVLNILGPSSEEKDENILLDIEDKKYAGYTHIALRVASLDDAEKLFNEKGHTITSRMSFKDMKAVFIRDPDRNVIEFDEYAGEHPETRAFTHKH
jgi:catechol 2,3-dioxygenase-like lactoylglutathione lyase family enzyme